MVAKGEVSLISESQTYANIRVTYTYIHNLYMLTYSKLVLLPHYLNGK